MSYIGNSPGVASQRVTTTLTATAAQTQFTTQSGYVLGYVDVYLNGAKLVNGSDFEAITGTYITLFAGAASGDVVELISYVPRGLTDGYTKAEADSKFLDVGGDTGQVVLTATGSATAGTGQVYLNGAASNRVEWNTNGTGAPAFTTRSAGTKLLLYPAISGSQVDYAVGIDAATLWSSVPVASSSFKFKWFGGQTEVASLDGTGTFVVSTLNLTNALGVASGGTGQTTANAALNALLPTQTGNATKYLQTDGTNTTWDAVSLSTADITGVLPLANGGTGATTAAGALTSLGAYAASNPSGYTTNTGTVTSVGGTGTVSGISLSGTVSTAGNLTLGGTLDLSAYSSAGAFSTLSASGAVTLSGGTANGVAYLNASKVLTSGSALTFNGTSLGVGSASYGNAGTINVSVGAPGTTIGGLQLWSTTTGNHYVQFGDGTTGTETYRGAVGYNHTADNLVFYSAGAIGMTLTSSSLYTASAINVGIGNSNPQTKLHITTDGTYDCLLLQSTASGNARSWNVGPNVGTNGVFAIRDSTAGENRLNIDLSGSVLVGTLTNTNSSKLVVNGTISQTVGGTQYLVVDQSDVGTAPNQIPLNQYLGSMAFQDRENVNFLGGTGALSSLDITAISAQLNVSAVDVFVYDTSKDSDGGAWRKRTQHTSWYNETLNTATRGSRREFPAVAVIVATADTVYILDGDDSTLPMWMVFVASRSPTVSLLSWYTSGTGSVRAVCMLNGILGLAMGGGIMMPNFISDKFKLGYQTTKYAIRNNTIAQRNDVSGGYATTSTTEGYVIQEYRTNDIAMTVLPDAPVDPATGLPVPTIAVGCMGGLSIIHNDHTVINRAQSWSNGGGVFEIAFDKNGGYWYSNAYYTELEGNPNHALVVAYAPSVYETGALPSSLSGYNATNGLQYLLGTPTPNSNTSHWGAIAALWLVSSYQNADAGKVLFTNGNHVGIQYGLSHFNTNKTSPTSGMVAYTTSKYSTGWMPGRIKGAWLSDITQETITATDLSSRATFYTSGRTTSYSYTNGTNTATLNWDENEVDGYITIRMGGLVEGKNYVINVLGSATFTPTSGYSNFVRYAPTGQVLYQVPGSEQGSLATTMTFRAVSSTDGSHEFNIYSKLSGGNYTATFSIGEADLDRSVNSKALQVFGNITKTPVAVGADLVGYGNNGVTTNYMKIPLSTNFIDLSTDFSVSFWLKSNGGSGYNGWSIAEDNQAGASGYDKTVINFFVQASDNCWAYRGKNITPPTDWIAQLNTWTHCVVTVIGTKTSFYANGRLVQQSNGWGYNPTVPYSLYLHSWSYNTQFYGQVPIEFSLFRLSKTAPSQEQIIKMYNDESYLFQPNAKVTLYGTSDTITALAYDDDTQLLHVGTSSGRSVFDGLRRVDNTTTAVATAISAADGLVVEN